MSNTPAIKLKTYIFENLTVVELEGNIQQMESDELEELLYGMFEEDKKNIIMDLQNTTQICSTALGFLVRFKRMLNEHGGDIKMVINNPQVLELFKVTMMDRIFETFDNLQESLNAF